MKVLWFAVTPSMYAANTTGHNGGGWIASLEALVRKVSDINLAIAFEHTDTCFKAQGDGITYYPINIWQSKLQKIKSKVAYQTEEKLLIPACIKIIDDFKPDVIHVFGSEWSFGLLSLHTSIPLIIHMQGSIPPYYNARFPVGYSRSDFLFQNGLNIKKIAQGFYADWHFKLRAAREERILRNCKFYMGRTEWDKNLTRLYSPNSKYFYCSEAIRDAFISTKQVWQKQNRSNYIFTSTISSPLYKGVDLILKTAKLFHQNTNFNFEWQIFGIKELGIHEAKTGIKAAEVNVKIMGTVNAEELNIALLNSNIFVHPSYIDNSPNSICEAMLLGLPIISTNVGGISSIIEDGVTGLLVPANDPFSMASSIIKILSNPKLDAELGANARVVALERHDPKQIVEDLRAAYSAMLQ